MKSTAPKYVIFCLISVYSFLLVSCERDYPEIDFKLPAQTQTGANTFGYIFKNKPWINYGEYCGSFIYCRENLNHSLSVIDNQFHKTMRFNIAAYNFIREDGKNKTYQSVQIALDSVSGPGTYFIKKSRSYQFVEFEDRLEELHYEVLPGKTVFTVALTKLDTANRIASGTFTGTLYNKQNSSDSIKIESGRFDVPVELWY